MKLLSRTTVGALLLAIGILAILDGLNLISSMLLSGGFLAFYLVIIAGFMLAKIKKSMSETAVWIVLFVLGLVPLLVGLGIIDMVGINFELTASNLALGLVFLVAGLYALNSDLDIIEA